MLPPKAKVLTDVGSLVQAGDLSLKELEEVYRHNAPAGASTEVAPEQASGKPGTTLAAALYIVGTVIVCMGIYLLIAQNWDQMNTPVRIAVTLGLGLVLFGVSINQVRRGRDANKDLLTACLLTIAATATTIGVGVVATEAHLALEATGTVTLLALFVVALFTGMYFLLVRSLMVLLFAIGAAVVAYYAGVDWATRFAEPHAELFYTAETMLAGVLLVAGGFAARARVLASRLTHLLHEVGLLFFLAAPFWLTLFSGFNDSSSNTAGLAYDMLFPFLLAGGVAFSVYAASRSLLVITTLFLTGYIIEISFEYFYRLLGGSIALCLAGVLVMGMAYGATRFAKRYITKQQSPPLH